MQRFSSTALSQAATASASCFRLISNWPGEYSVMAAAAGMLCASAWSATRADEGRIGVEIVHAVGLLRGLDLAGDADSSAAAAADGAARRGSSR